LKTLLQRNREAWNKQSENATSRWVQPVSAEDIAAAKSGRWEVILTPTLPVPRDWFGHLQNADVLALASGGGQQAPILAAAGARVISLDNSDAQLAKDAMVAEREQLSLTCEQGDMADLSRFEDASFDLVFHPVSNVFAESILPVWRECFRVLRPTGRLLAGFMNPCFFLFDHEAIEKGGPLSIKYSLPYSDLSELSDKQIDERIARGEAVEFSHSLDTQLGGQLAAGFSLQGFYEDRWDNDATPLNAYMPTSMATLAMKPTAEVNSV
jgi:SAM-dependent methyltransferase